MSRYPGARGQRRRRVAPLLHRGRVYDENVEVEPLMAAFENRNVETGIASHVVPAPRLSNNNKNRLEAMNISQMSGRERNKNNMGSSADELLWANEESSPLLQNQSPPSSSRYTSPQLSLVDPAVRKAKGHLAKIHRHHSLSRHYSPTNQGSVVLVVARNRNPAPDSAGWLCARGCCCCQCVRTNQVGVVEHLGRFQDLVGPGRHCIPLWPLTRIAARVSMRIQQLDVTLETKTQDNVFVHLQVVILFRVSNVYKAHYTLSNAQQQIKAYVLDEVRSTVPRMNVSEVFAQSSDIALNLTRRLQGCMSTFGYEIIDALVKRIAPNPLIVESMNEINASKRIKDSMPHKAEAFKVKRLKEAEAAAERSFLEGVGVANQRKAIVAGMKETLQACEDQFAAKDVMDILLLSHYMDVLVAIGGTSMMVQHNPGRLVDLEEQLSCYFNAEKNKRDEESVPVEIPDLLW